MSTKLVIDGVQISIDTFGAKITGVGRAAAELRDAVLPGFQGAFLVVGNCADFDVRTSKKEGRRFIGIVNAERVVRIPQELVTDLLDQADEAAAAAGGQSRLPGMEAPPPVKVVVDGDGTVLTDAEVAHAQGVPARDAGPTLEEAEAWWEERTGGSYQMLDAGEVLAQLEDVPLSRLDCLDVLEQSMGDPSAELLAAIAERRGRGTAVTEPAAPADPVGEARQWVEDKALFGVDENGMSITFEDHIAMAAADEDHDEPLSLLLDYIAQDATVEELVYLRALADVTAGVPAGLRDAIIFRDLELRRAVAASVVGLPTEGTPLEEKLPVHVVRERLNAVSDRALLDRWRQQEENRGSKTRKRVVDAIANRIARIDADTAPAPAVCAGSGGEPTVYSDGVATCSVCEAPVTVRTDGKVPRHGLKRGSAPAGDDVEAAEDPFAPPLPDEGEL